MPTVPSYTSNQVQQAALPSVRSNPEAPAEAFNGGASAQALGRAASGLLSESASIANEAKKNADDVATQDAFAKTVQMKNQMMYDPQSGAMNKRGKDALGVSEEYGDKFDQFLAQTSDGLANDQQRALFHKMALDQKTELSATLERHTFTETKNFENETFQSGMKASQDDAILNYQNPGAVEKSLYHQKALIQSNAQRNGLPLDGEGSEIVQQQLAEAASKTHSMVIERMLVNGQAKEAQSYYDQAKPKILGGDSIQVDKGLEAGLALNKGLDAWDKVRGMTLPDGHPDEAKMQSAVMSDDSMSDKDKEAAWSFVKARAGEAKQQKSQADAANERDFMNQLVKGRQGGKPLDAALRTAQQFGTDDYDKVIKAEAAKKMYSTTVTTDPQAYIGLWERVQSGEGSSKEIDQAMQADKISVQDWTELRKQYFKTALEGEAPGAKSAWERVKDQAEQQFGSDKDLKGQFMYDMHVSAKDKAPEEILKMAQDKLKAAPGTGWFGSDVFNKPQYQVDVKRLDAQNVAWGKAYEDVGKQETSAIGQAVLYSGKKNWAPGDIDAFASQFGGYDAIKTGTPVNNAIQSLIAKKQVATPANIKWVLERNPDGVWK